MSRKGYIVIVLLLTLCTAGAAPALPLAPEAADTAGEGGVFRGLWDRFMNWIGQMSGGEGGGGLTVLEMDTCHLDPNGGGPCAGGS